MFVSKITCWGGLILEKNSRLLSGYCFLLGSLMLTGCLSAPTVAVPKTGNTSSGFSAVKGLAEREQAMGEKLANAPRERVFWAGVATSCDFADINKRFPAVHNCAAEFGTVLDSAVRSVHPATFDLANTGVEPVSFESRDALVMAVVLDRERRRVEPIDVDGQTKYMVELGIQGQLVFVDLKEKVITYSFPISCRALDVLPTKPSENDFQKMAKVALFKAERADGKPVNLKDQFLDRLASKKATPRSPISPLAVRRVRFADSCATPQFVGLSSSQITTTDKLREREDELGSEFAAYLASSVSLGVNPYSRELGNGGALMAKLSFMDNRLLNAQLRPPARVFDIEIDSLICELDSKKSSQFTTVLNYGFKGRVNVCEPLLGTVKLTQDIDFTIAGLQKRPLAQGEHISGVPTVLRANYQKLVLRRVLPEQLNSDELDHSFGFGKSLENFLSQLQNEMFFESEDGGKRYGPLRDDCFRGHLFN